MVRTRPQTSVGAVFRAPHMFFYVAVQKGAEDVTLALFKAINHILDWLPGLSSVTLVTEKM